MFSTRNVHNHEKSVYKRHSFDIKYGQFKDTHSNKKVIRHNMRGIKSKHHKIYTYESNKTSLSYFDYKCYILSDGINKYITIWTERYT